MLTFHISYFIEGLMDRELGFHQSYNVNCFRICLLLSFVQVDESGWKLAFIVTWQTLKKLWKKSLYGPLEDTETLGVVKGSIVFGQFSTPKLLKQPYTTLSFRLTSTDVYLQKLP